MAPLSPDTESTQCEARREKRKRAGRGRCGHLADAHLVHARLVDVHVAKLGRARERVPRLVGLHARGEGLDKAGAKGGVEAALLVHRHQVLRVQGKGARPADVDDVALVELQVDGARNMALCVCVCVRVCVRGVWGNTNEGSGVLVVFHDWTVVSG